MPLRFSLSAGYHFVNWPQQFDDDEPGPIGFTPPQTVVEVFTQSEIALERCFVKSHFLWTITLSYLSKTYQLLTRTVGPDDARHCLCSESWSNWHHCGTAALAKPIIQITQRPTVPTDSVRKNPLLKRLNNRFETRTQTVRE